MTITGRTRLEVALCLGLILGLHLLADLIWLDRSYPDVLSIADESWYTMSLNQMIAYMRIKGVAGFFYSLKPNVTVYLLVGHIPRALAGVLLEPSYVVVRLANYSLLLLLLLGVYRVASF